MNKTLKICKQSFDKDVDKTSMKTSKKTSIKKHENSLGLREE